MKEKTLYKDLISFFGFIENDKISKYSSKSRGSILPSFSETIGVVYAESLLCGTPILYSKGTGFDGIFENVVVSVESHYIENIARGIQTLIKKTGFLLILSESYTS